MSAIDAPSGASLYDPMGSFQLHPDLAKGGLVIGDLPLCGVLLINDSRYPWVVLVPRGEGLCELYDLSAPERTTLMEEIASLSQAMARLFSADKMNVGALGNITPQLHIHVIARRHGDEAWPAPVWGKHPPLPYSESEARARVDLLRGQTELAWVNSP